MGAGLLVSRQEQHDEALVPVMLEHEHFFSTRLDSWSWKRREVGPAVHISSEAGALGTSVVL